MRTKSIPRVSWGTTKSSRHVPFLDGLLVFSEYIKIQHYWHVHSPRHCDKQSKKYLITKYIVQIHQYCVYWGRKKCHNFRPMCCCDKMRNIVLTWGRLCSRSQVFAGRVWGRLSVDMVSDNIRPRCSTNSDKTRYTTYDNKKVYANVLFRNKQNFSYIHYFCATKSIV